jgi:hypothetical protein
MKKILLVALTAVALASCQQKTGSTSTGKDSTSVAVTSPAGTESTPDSTKEESKLNPRGAVLNLVTDTYNFGKIKKGEIVSYSFKFKNTGVIPLIIKDAIATCGCTVPEPPTKPIKPSEESEIRVVFNSAGKPIGAIEKAVNVTSNALNNPVQLRLVGEITQ